MLLKQVAHAVHKNRSRSRTLERLGHFFRHQLQVEALFVRMAFDAAKTLGKCLRVAVFAARTDFGTAPKGIPRCISPLDFGVIAHRARPLLSCSIVAIRIADDLLRLQHSAPRARAGNRRANRARGQAWSFGGHPGGGARRERRCRQKRAMVWQSKRSQRRRGSLAARRAQ
jgi:hypothetical protein